jgi:hypothetical protein
MKSETMDDVLSKLQHKVNRITSQNGSNNNNIISSNISNTMNIFKLKSSLMIYIAIPIVIIVILCLMKPNFITIKSTNDDDTYNISYKKVLISTLIFCLILGASIIGWKYYKK